MGAIPALVLLCGAVALGVVLGIEYLRRKRSRPTVIGLHALLGAATVEVMAMLLRGPPSGVALPGGTLARVATGLLAFALCAGLVAPMIGRRSRATMSGALVVHVTAAAAGFILCLAWVVRAPA